MPTSRAAARKRNGFLRLDARSSSLARTSPCSNLGRRSPDREPGPVGCCSYLPHNSIGTMASMAGVETMRIAIVGGGATGTLAAAHLARRLSRRAAEIVLVEPDEE